MKNFVKNSLLVLVLALTFFSCKKDNDTIEPENENITNPIGLEKGITENVELGKIVYQPNTIVFNQALKDLVTEITSESIEMDYNPSLDLVKIGDVLFSGSIDGINDNSNKNSYTDPRNKKARAFKDGFARVVTGAERIGEKIIYTTRQALWEEALVLVDFNGDIGPFDFKGFEAFPENSIGIEGSKIGFEVESEVNENSLELNLTLDLDNNLDTSLDQVKINGTIEMINTVQPRLILFNDGSIENTVISLVGVTEFKTSVGFSWGSKIQNGESIDFEDVQLSEDNSLAQLVNREFIIGKIPNPLGFSIAGQFEIGVQLVLFARLELNAAGEIGVVFRKDFLYNFEANFIGSREDKWSFQVSQLNEEPMQTEYRLSAEIEAEVSPVSLGIELVFPQFLKKDDFSLGLYFDLAQFYGEMDLEYNINTACFELDLDAGIRAEVYFETKLSGLLPRWTESLDIQSSLFTINYTSSLFDDNTLSPICLEDEDGPKIEIPVELNFPETSIGTTSTLEFTITNSGDELLSISPFDFPFDVYESNNSGGILDPQQSRTITISFTPQQAIDYNGLVLIESNASNSTNNINQFLITGSGTTATTGDTYEGDIQLTSQQQVIEFGANNYVGVNGLLTIGTYDDESITSDINDLSALSSLQTVTSLNIYNNNQLSTLQGLNNLSTVNEGLYIYRNNISSLSGLSGLVNANFFSIDNNSSLLNLNGLNGQLTSFKNLFVTNNQNLNSLEGLNNITSVNQENVSQANQSSFVIFNNNSLENLNGLQNLREVGWAFRIGENSSLESLDGLNSLNFVGSNFEIVGNGTLSDYCELQDFLTSTSLTPFINSNQFNPSKEQIIEGNCNESNSSNAVIDIDGNTYETIQIGNQVWFKENLKTTKFRNGDNIPTGLTGEELRLTSNSAFTNLDVDLYGLYYNWFAISDVRGLCPEGFRVPTDADIDELNNFIGFDGGQLKSTSNLWSSPNSGATNLTQFTAEPAGQYRFFPNEFHDVGENAIFWTSIEHSSTGATSYHLSNVNSNLSIIRDQIKTALRSCRCIGE